MSDKTKPAFPSVGKWKDKWGEEADVDRPGMTLREYYAGLAMQGLVSYFGQVNEGTAETAVEMADYLIDELQKGQGE